jgi:hypothetical protein
MVAAEPVFRDTHAYGLHQARRGCDVENAGMASVACSWHLGTRKEGQCQFLKIGRTAP